MSALVIRLRPRAASRRRRRGPLERHCLRMFLLWLAAAAVNVAVSSAFGYAGLWPAVFACWVVALPCGWNLGSWHGRWQDARRRGL